MPAQAARTFYAQNSTWAKANIQWLIDTKRTAVAVFRDSRRLCHKLLQVNIEIDVGLHRGGVQSETQFAEMLSVIEQYPLYLKPSRLDGLRCACHQNSHQSSKNQIQAYQRVAADLFKLSKGHSNAVSSPLEQ